MAVKDITIDQDGDLLIENGDFVVSESDMQHLMLIINLSQGSLKQFPLQGVGIIRYSGSSNQGRKLERDIKVKTEADGYSNVTVLLKQGSDGVFQYDIDAERQ